MPNCLHLAMVAAVVAEVVLVALVLSRPQDNAARAKQLENINLHRVFQLAWELEGSPTVNGRLPANIACANRQHTTLGYPAMS